MPGGSSPLARGLRRAAHLGRLDARIIPARAGFTSGSRHAPRHARDHPRSRGVYRRYPSTDLLWAGSSPLARGLRERRRGRLLGARIIPARAGFTSSSTVSGASTTDHPRSRGVYVSHEDMTMNEKGSSPLARGLPQLVRNIPHDAGIIPARAGFTSRSCSRGTQPRDHPRSRGVYSP